MTTDTARQLLSYPPKVDRQLIGLQTGVILAVFAALLVFGLLRFM